MKYHRLGKSDLNVSEISFGCMSLGEDQVANEKLLHQAFEQGINFFDTADLYQKGWNEESVGRALQPIRDKVIIATKVGNQWRADASGWDWNPRKAYILKSIDESLRRLQTDYIDLYQLHGGTLEDPSEETIEAFEVLQKAGKIRYYGISSIRPNVIRRFIQKSNIVSVMMQYSLLDRRPEESCLDLLHQAGISVISRGTLAKGMLINKPPQDYLGYSAAKVRKIQQSSQTLGNPVGNALSYVLQHPAVSSVVAGIRTPGQLDGLLEGYRQEVQSEDLEKLAKVLAPKRYEKHR
ncbi:MAG: aldo/keto reductase [Bacteroidota bacterium]